MRIIAYLTIPLLVVLTHPVFAEPAGKAEPQSTEPAVAELSLRNQLAKVMQPILDLYRSGNRDAAAYAEYLDRMDALYEASDPADLEFRTTVLATKGSIYQNILKDMDAAMKEYKHLQKDAAGTPMAEKAEELIAGIEMQRALVVGGEFPGFSFTGLNGETIDLEDYRGRVVLLDFWATWCRPCIIELPHVIKTYRKYHDKKFEIIGISLDKDKERLEKFIADKGMDWPQYYDGKGWDNELSTKYAIQSIPATFLLGPDGKIIDRDLRGEELEGAVAKALDAL